MPAVAGAWTQPADQEESYWSPGPPPGSEATNDCYVTTENGIFDTAPFANLFDLNGYGSQCQVGYSQVVAYNSGYEVNGPAIQTNPNQWGDSTYLSGWTVAAANYGACGPEYCSYWEASWLG
jgi:hypothetical protein